MSAPHYSIFLQTVCVVDSGGPKEVQVKSYSSGGTNMPTWEGTLAHLANTVEPSVCGGDAVLMLNYFNQLFYRPDALPDTQPTASKHRRQSTANRINIHQCKLKK